MRIRFGRELQSINSFLASEGLEGRNVSFLLKSLIEFTEELYRQALAGQVYDFSEELQIDAKKGLSIQSSKFRTPSIEFRKLNQWKRNGFTWELGNDSAGKFDLLSAFKKTETICLEPGLKAPEENLGHRDMRSSMFSLGLLCTSMFSSADIFSEDDYESLLKGELQEYRWVDQRFPMLVSKCLKLNPEDRISWTEFVSEVKSIGADQTFLENDKLSPYNRVLGQYRTSLLDFSSRNQLFHFAKNQSHVNLPIDIPSLASDTFIYRFESGDTSGELEQLHRIRRKQQKDLREKGADNLYVLVSFLKWKNPEDEEWVNSPLLLTEVELQQKKGFEITYHLSIESRELRVNEVLRMYFREHFEIELPSAVPIGRAYVEQFYTELKEHLKGGGASGWSIESQCVLGNFSYRNTSIAADYDKILRKPALPVLNRILGFASSEEPENGLSSTVTFDERVQVLPADLSQENCLNQAKSGSLVIEGPPGTGKSQTIVNLLAQGIAKGERVLFVSEKKPALDVVYSRLKESGIGALALLLHDQIKEKKDCIESLRTSYERLGMPLERRAALGKQLAGWKLQELLDELDHYFKQVREEKHGFLLNRLFLLADVENEGLSVEDVPDYSAWKDDSEVLDEIAKLLEKNYNASNWYDSPLLHLNENAFSKSEKPELDFKEKLNACAASIDKLVEWEKKLAKELPSSLGDLLQIRSLCKSLKWLIERDLVKLVLSENSLLQGYTSLRDEYLAKKALFEKRKSRSASSIDVSPRELESALDELKNKGRSEEIEAFVRDVLLVEGEWFVDDIQSILRNAVLAEKSAEQLVVIRSKFQSRFQSNDPDTFIEQVSLLQDIARRTAYHMPEFFALLDEKRFPDRILQTVLQMDTAFSTLEDSASWLHKSFRDLDLKQLKKYVKQLETDFSMDQVQVKLLNLFNGLSPLVKHCLYVADASIEKLGLLAAKKEVNRAFVSYPDLEKYDSAKLNKVSNGISTAYDEWLEWNAHYVLDSRVEALHELSLLAEVPAARLKEEEKQRKWRFKKGLRLLKHEFDKSKQFKSLRELYRTEAASVIDQLKPVCLMSPTAVAEVFPCEAERFDLVVFDEASQIRMEDVLPICYRAKKIVVVGDNKQLPPSDFFRSQRIEASTGDGLKFSSFLTACRAAFPVAELGWHYRSASTSLIEFSNAAFYENKLSVFPYASQLRVPFKVERVVDGLYENRQNQNEAKALVAHLAKELIEHPERSYAVITLSETQQHTVERAIEGLCEQDMAFKRAIDREEARTENGAYNGLVVRNLENMQGEERDIVYISIGYAFNAEGKFASNFGPIMHEGGERRLNVLFSRAKKGIRLFTSFEADAIKNDRNIGLWTLKQYLRYAKAIEQGDEEVQRDVLAVLSGKYLKDDMSSGQAFEEENLVLERLRSLLGEEGISLKRLRFGSTDDLLFEVLEPDNKRLLLYLENREVATWRETFIARRVLEQRGYTVFQISTQELGRAPENVLSQVMKKLKA